LPRAGTGRCGSGFFNATSFGQTDPLFGRDISFYVFRLPVWQSLQQQALITAVLAAVGCGLYYVLSGSFVIEPRHGAGFFPRIRLVTRARRHMGLLAALVFLLIAWGTWFSIPGTLTSQANVIHGASYVDLYARIPILRATVAVLILGSGLALFYGFTRSGWPLPVAVLLYLVVSFGGGIYSASIQRLIVVPDELNREQPYIVYGIAATRKAYALDRVEEREVTGDAELSAKDIIANSATIENIRLWDHQPLLQTFAQIQEIRTYYDFTNVDNDRYMINGGYRQVMLSARELNTESMQNRSWVNERLIYTHGYGLTLGPVNQVTTEGLPVLFIRDLPPVSTVNIRIDRPSIYFGELSSSYALVKTKQKEFHYPKGDDNEVTTYDGDGGVPIGTFLRRLMFAIRFADTDILFTNQLTSESRILYHRKIADRVQLLAPFLAFDADPYPRPVRRPSAVDSGRVYDDAALPVLQADDVPGRNDQLHSQLGEDRHRCVPRIDDALPRRSGRSAGANPRKDLPGPAATTLRDACGPAGARALPGRHFQDSGGDVSGLPHDESDGLLQQRRPVAGACPRERARGGSDAAVLHDDAPSGSDKTEFIQMLPFTPRLKDNLAAWMVARSDGEHYGRMLVFQFPKQKVVFGPKQIVGKINQDQLISPQITLWNQQGSRVIWGTLLVIPVKESLLYVRPLYLQSPEGRIPELKQVIVAYQNRIEMAETLTRALGKIFGSSVISALAPDQLSSSATSVVITAPEGEAAVAAATPAGTTPVGDATIASLISEMQQHYEAADKAMKSGDLVLWAEENKKVREIFDRLVKLKKQP
jgi:uncharacterized membrane protein (UPF0182 family)